MNREIQDDETLLDVAKGRGYRMRWPLLFDKYRSRLRRMVELRLDDRLAGRIDPSDVLQEAFIDVHKRIGELKQDDIPFFLWLRLKVGNRLIDLHRFHLGAPEAICHIAKYRCSEVRCRWHRPRRWHPRLLGGATSVSNAAMRAEARVRVQELLNGMEDIDREVLVLAAFRRSDQR